MATVTAFEAKTHMGRILDRVANGEEIVITRHDKPVARLVPESRPPAHKVREAIARIRAIGDRRAAEGVAPLTIEEIRESIQTGRR